MELFASDDHLFTLKQAVGDPVPRVRAQARKALTNQQRTPAWERAMIDLLDTRDVEVRRLALQCLAERRPQTATAALENHFERETDGQLRATIARLLGR